uniref:Saposin B-type domain-containing protein n=1 Tax=Ditylenchus dipsaci TaxID=166011 RepID=A0A915D7A2_9BILA
MNSVLRFTVLFVFFLIALNVNNVFGRENEEQFEQANGMKCNICKNIVSSPTVWHEKMESSLVAQLKHCHELFEDHRGSPHFHAAMFACHEFAKNGHVSTILDSVNSNSALGNAHCSRFC